MSDGVNIKGVRWFIRFEWNPHDLWVGIFWRKYPKSVQPALQLWDVFICPLPTVVIHIFQGVKF